MNTNAHETFEKMEKMMQNVEGFTFPPKCFVEMNGRFIDYKENEFLRVSFPVFERYSNPSGGMLGGMISAAFDNTFGPFSFLTAKRPTASLDLNVAFHKSIHPDEKEIFVEATIVTRSKRFIVFEGKAYNQDNELIATGTSRMIIRGV